MRLVIVTGMSGAGKSTALKMLEHDGLIARIPSKGTFVLRRTPAPRPGKVRTILLLQQWLWDGMSVGSAASFMLTGPSTKITNLGALKIVLMYY